MSDIYLVSITVSGIKALTFSNNLSPSKRSITMWAFVFLIIEAWYAKRYQTATKPTPHKAQQKAN